MPTSTPVLDAAIERSLRCVNWGLISAAMHLAGWTWGDGPTAATPSARKLRKQAEELMRDIASRPEGETCLGISTGGLWVGWSDDENCAPFAVTFDIAGTGMDQDEFLRGDECYELNGKRYWA